MVKSINIIIAEPSEILYRGMADLLADFSNSARIKRSFTLEETELLLMRNPESIVIANPTLVQNRLKDFQEIRSRWTDARWIAFLHVVHENSILNGFDGTISINDSPEAIISVVKNTSKNKATDSQTVLHSLSSREIEVLRLIATGSSNKEIATRLNLSVNTIITHRKNISGKTGIKTLSGLTIYAVVNKLIAVDDNN
ncbi:MAG: response regulator transcription factor [Bacteroidales bacterium]